MQIKKLPYGISDYERLIEQNYYYVDKTPYIEKIENLAEPYIMFLRPRKFGKTLFTSVLENYYDIIIITGVRLEKELNFLKQEFNAILIKVERNIDNNLTEKQKNDITETDMDNFKEYDYIIQNNEDINKLKEKIMEVVS